MHASDKIALSDTSYESSDPRAVIESVISFVNGLLEQYLTLEEIPVDAVRSYYVDYYLAQVENGGFSQFVHNCGWDPVVVARVREGLHVMGAARHLALFERAARVLDGFKAEQLTAYLDGDYFGDNADRDALDDAITEEIITLCEIEDLTLLNSRWLRSLPNVVTMTESAVRDQIARLGAALPDRELRVARARAREPEYMKLIRALCDAASQQLARVTGGDPTHLHQGKQTIAWHFLTDRGHHYMVIHDDVATMFVGDSNDPVTSIDVPRKGSA